MAKKWELLIVDVNPLYLGVWPFVGGVFPNDWRGRMKWQTTHCLIDLRTVPREAVQLKLQAGN